MPGYGAAVRGQDDQPSAVAFASRGSGFGVVVVVMDLVAVRMVGEQRAHMDVAVPWLPAGVVVVQHGPMPGSNATVTAAAAKPIPATRRRIDESLMGEL